MVEPLFVIVWLFFGLLFIANIVLVIWGLVDAIKVPDDSMYRAGTKLIWVLVILLAGFVGTIVYFAVGRPSSETRTVGPLRATDPHLPPPPPGAFSCPELIHAAFCVTLSLSPVRDLDRSR